MDVFLGRCIAPCTPRKRICRFHLRGRAYKIPVDFVERHLERAGRGREVDRRTEKDTNMYVSVSAYPFTGNVRQEK